MPKSQSSQTRLGSVFSVRFAFCVLAVSLLSSSVSVAQPVGRRGGRPSPEQIEEMKAKYAAQQAAKAQANAQEQNKPKDEEKKPDDKSKEKKDEGKKEEESSGTVSRPNKPSKDADRDELKVTPDKDGYVQFSFKGQPWPDVLQWYADVSGLSFNWTKLPEGFLNLTTQRKYKLNETRDLLNKHLLLHGYTIVVSGDTMTAVEVAKLDPSLIPRVEADDLEDHLPHDIVRVRFELPKNMEPEQAANDVKILTSTNAKIQPLLATKRLHVIDTVANLRNVRDLIYAQQAAIKEDIRPVQFMIKHRRADYVADQVMIVLGLDPASRKTPQELQIEQQRMQLYAQMMKKDPNKVSKMLKSDGPEVHLVVNQRRNSILVNADPATLDVIQRTIDQVDVPDDGGE
ncbi:MAG: secretin N-terminal domain-containing protein, partial [Lacipirellulaceae bacterium]